MPVACYRGQGTQELASSALPPEWNFSYEDKGWQGQLLCLTSVEGRDSHLDSLCPITAVCVTDTAHVVGSGKRLRRTAAVSSRGTAYVRPTPRGPGDTFSTRRRRWPGRVMSWMNWARFCFLFFGQAERYTMYSQALGSKSHFFPKKMCRRQTPPLPPIGR